MRTPVETAASLEVIVEAMNSIDIEELDTAIAAISRDEGIGPLLDPTLWAHGGMMDAAHGTKKVLQAIRDFKVEVSGIGNFATIA